MIAIKDLFQFEHLSRGEKVAIALVPLVSCLLAFIVFKLVSGAHIKNAQARFERDATDAATTLVNTLEKHTNLLLSLQGLFHASESVSRLEFNKFIKSIDSETNFPEAAAISWNALVPPTELASFEEAVRADNSLVAGGYPDFSVRPIIENELAVVVAYTEPMKGNEGALGFNIASNPARLAAVEQARDTNESVVTAPIILAQETESQKAFLMLLPVYAGLDPVDTEQRRQDFDGLVVAVFRFGDLIERSARAKFDYFQVQDFTVPDAPPEDQLVHSRGTESSSESFSNTRREVVVGGRTWLLSFQRNIETNDSGERAIEFAATSLAGLASLLAGALFGTLATSRRRAIIHADKLTLELQETNEELTRSNADLSQFAHVASHDLQTPVRNVISVVTLLEEKLGDNVDPEVQEYMGFLNKSSTRMRTLVTDLLTFARLGREEVVFAQVELNDVLQTVMESTKVERETSNCKLEIDRLPTVVGDAGHYLRVFENLILNAIKYTNEDKTPEIHIGHVSNQTTSGQNQKTNSANMVYIKVSDNAQGIPEKFHATVFLPFRRLHRYDDIPGTGLGLGICKQIIERHGGNISIDQSSSEGTSFLIAFPRTAPQEISQ